MKLISMTEYVFEQEKKEEHVNGFYNIIDYAKSLKQPLKLGMFVPCDKNDVPLDEPIDYKFWIQDSEFGAYNGCQENKCIEYQQAKECVIFKDCEYKGEDKDSFWIYFKQFSKEDNENSKYDYTVIYKNKTLEHCVGFELTDSAIKKYNL